MNWALLQNSLLVSGLTTVACVAAGFATALWLAALEHRFRGPFLILACTSLVLPPFLVTNCWIDLLGLNGVLHNWVPLKIYSLGGTVWLLTLLTWPITLLSTLAALQRLESSQLESDPALTSFSLVRHLLWPLARSYVGIGAVLTFVLALNNFSVPTILQVKVFPAEAWLRYYTNEDLAGTFLVSWPLILAPLILIIVLHRAHVSWPRHDSIATAPALRRQLGPALFWSAGALGIALVLLSVAVPLLQLLGATKTWTEIPGLLRAIPASIWNSLFLASAAASLCVLAGLLTWRWPLQGWLWFPLLVPGVLLGIVLILVFNRPALQFIYGSAAIVMLAWLIRFLPIAWHGVARALHGVDPDLTDAARLCGASGWSMLRHVYWPQIAPQVAVAWYLTYLFCLWDVETLILLMPAGGETLALRIFNLLHYGHHAQVNALCVLLLGLAATPLLLFGAWRGLSRMIPASLNRVSVTCLSAALLVMLLPGCSPSAPEGQAPLSSRFFVSVHVIGSRGTAAGRFNKPRSLTVDKYDNLYVVDMTARVQKFSPSGEFLLSWQLTQTDIGKPKGMGVAHDGRILVVEPHYSRVNHFATNGHLVEQWGRHGTNAGELAFPRAVAANSKGDLFVSEYGVTERVQQFTAHGRFIQSLGRPGDGPAQFNRPEGLAIDTRDFLYVADSCNHRIQVFGPTGAFLRAYGRPGTRLGELSYPYDVRVDAAGNQFVCEFGNSRIQIFDSSDRAVETLGGAGTAAGQFNNPWAIALDSRGNLYVADSLNHRVQKFIRR